MQTLVIVLQCRKAFLAAGNVVRGGVHDVAGEQLLPEREAAGGTLEELTSLVWRGGRGGGRETVCGRGGIEGVWYGRGGFEEVRDDDWLLTSIHTVARGHG